MYPKAVVFHLVAGGARVVGVVNDPRHGRTAAVDKDVLTARVAVVVTEHLGGEIMRFSKLRFKNECQLHKFYYLKYNDTKYVMMLILLISYNQQHGHQNFYIHLCSTVGKYIYLSFVAQKINC